MSTSSFHRKPDKKKQPSALEDNNKNTTRKKLGKIERRYSIVLLAGFRIANRVTSQVVYRTQRFLVADDCWLVK